MRRIIKGILYRTWKPYVQWYLKSPRSFTWGRIKITVQPEVFHPGFYFSTAYFLKYISGLRLSDLNILEAGSGSGLISIYCAQQGATVSSCDINPAAVRNTSANAVANNVKITAIESDLFDKMPPAQFDLILVNPPYYKKDPQTPEEHAWYCGSGLEYFHKLFLQSKGFVKQSAEMLMVLSDECDIEGIRSIAQKHGWKSEIKKEKLIRWERNFILSFKPERFNN
jgi:release factor glutamine methyltransferase